jgi:hypothetical protein
VGKTLRGNYAFWKSRFSSEPPSLKNKNFWLKSEGFLLIHTNLTKYLLQKVGQVEATGLPHPLRGFAMTDCNFYFGKVVSVALGSPLLENHSKQTIKMVKARGYELMAVTRLKPGVDLRDFDLTIGISV